MTLDCAPFLILCTKSSQSGRKQSKMVIGTRGSELARTQTEWVRKFLERKLDAPVNVRIISTQGDRVTDRPLRELEGSGYFTKELEEALLDGRIDIAVHSYKDMPSRMPDGLELAAVSVREDAADLLIMRPDVMTQSAEALFVKRGAIVGTSAVRRETQLKSLRPDIETRDLRGNVPTRLNKLREGQYDAILLASAGVRRLNLSLSDFRVHRLDPTRFVPAPGQGALAIQMRKNDRYLEHVRAAIHSDETWMATKIERQVQSLLGGGCGLPLGAYACNIDNEWTMEGFWYSEQTGAVRATVHGPDPELLPRDLYDKLTAARQCPAEY